MSEIWELDEQANVIRKFKPLREYEAIESLVVRARNILETTDEEDWEDCHRAVADLRSVLIRRAEAVGESLAKDR